MENGLCKYSLVSFVQLSFILCNAQEAVEVGCKIGATAMSMLDNFDYSEMKSMVVNIYSYVQQHCYPLHKVAENVLKVSQPSQILFVVHIRIISLTKFQLS